MSQQDSNDPPIDDDNENNKEVVVEFSRFLINVPPQSITTVQNFRDSYGNQNRPTISIHCDHDFCVGKDVLLHRYKRSETLQYSGLSFLILLYECSNCQKQSKTFAILVLSIDDTTATCIKLGEHPNFGPPTSARLLTIIGSDRELFLKGRRCEIQGLGIASFAYYRRVIEDQKERLFDQIIKVTKLLEPTSHLIQELNEAKKEYQFTKSIGTIKTALPQTLFIKGENPLLLLHSALSEGLHSKSDEECLEMASSVRLILSELAQKITLALNDDKELANAVKKLKAARNNS